MLGMWSLVVTFSYLRDLTKRKEFILIKNLEINVEKVNNVLSYLLPEFVKKRVKNGVRYIAEDKGTVSIIFIDICNFDQIINIYTPSELISFLDDIFSRIDKLCECFGVSKIETVGKTYLACAGLQDSDAGIDSGLISIPHARRAVEMALALLQEMENFQVKDGSFLTFKIGINSGPVTAGVVGYHKPQFSLVGDTVNTASRMCSTLTENNSIQISSDTFELLGDKRGLVFYDRIVKPKGKSEMKTKIVSIPNSTSDKFNDYTGPFAKSGSS